MEAGRKGETWGVWRSVMAPVGHDTPLQGCRWPWPLIQGTAAEWPNFTNGICCRWWAQAPHVSELFEQQFSAVRVRRSFVDFALFITQSSIFSCLCLLFISPFQNLGCVFRAAPTWISWQVQIQVQVSAVTSVRVHVWNWTLPIVRSESDYMTKSVVVRLSDSYQFPIRSRNL